MTRDTATGTEDLIEGYRQFRRSEYPTQKRLFETLAARGQVPQTMVISCCDSRVDPAQIFSAGPGELFVVRNVANLVPPCGKGGDYHGTSAALEFAVTGLKVRNIVVLGHASCGGVRACLEGANDPDVGGRFIGPWMSILTPARDRVLSEHAGASDETRQRALEHAGVRQSIENLHSFPFVAQALAAGELRLHGAYFGIATGELAFLDSASGEFRTVA
ncbi:MAG: carbonic anhydrase [Kiloniellales bacterium]|nr:carbonic anhydrase [Kiloniellales bacterium]